jgi:hypothetical protein
MPESSPNGRLNAIERRLDALDLALRDQEDEYVRRSDALREGGSDAVKEAHRRIESQREVLDAKAAELHERIDEALITEPLKWHQEKFWRGSAVVLAGFVFLILQALNLIEAETVKWIWDRVTSTSVHVGEH